MPKRYLAGLAATAVIAACVPPPPLGGSAFGTANAARVVQVNGQVVCTASLGLDLILDNDQTMEMISDVIVRGPGLPGLPCVYSAWVFSAQLSCDDITADGCGDWNVATPNGDTSEFRLTVRFNHRPDNATMGVAFTGTWGGSITDTVVGRTSIIRCDPVTQGHRCLFQPNN
jgi:hypothetical protein